MPTLCAALHVVMDGWMDGWVILRMNERTDKGMNEHTSKVITNEFNRGSIFLGAHGPTYCNTVTNSIGAIHSQNSFEGHRSSPPVLLTLLGAPSKELSIITYQISSMFAVHQWTFVSAIPKSLHLVYVSYKSQTSPCLFRTSFTYSLFSPIPTHTPYSLPLLPSLSSTFCVGNMNWNDIQGHKQGSLMGSRAIRNVHKHLLI